MKKLRKMVGAVGVGSLCLGLVLKHARGQNTIYFSPSGAGQTKSVVEWGVDTAWPNYDNVRQSVAHMGANNVDVVRMTFHPAYPLTPNGNGTYSLSDTAKGFINNQLSLANLAGSKPLTLMPGEFASTFDYSHWLRTIKATQEYINSRPGFTTRQIKSIEVFNEPDYWIGQGNATDLNNLINQLKTDPVFQNTSFPAPSTLNSNNARGWYDVVPAATHGSSHLLGGSMTSYVDFIQHVKSTGKSFINPELHSLGEAIIGAEHGMTSGIFWGDVLRARGLFVKASDGKRLGYAENLDRQSAAAVYRAPDGNLYAFAGGVERFGKATSFRFVSDQDVYFNGIPVREFMLPTKFDETDAVNPPGNDFENYGSWSNQGAYADIDLDGTGIPALDGHRWKIVNAATGQVMEVAGSGTADGALIRSAADADGLNQKWNIVRTRNGYYHLFNANSGRTAEVANGSLSNGASVRQWGTADNQIQQWYIEEAGNGAFYIRNAHSNKFLTSNSSNSTQFDLNGSSTQKWKFVLTNPVAAAKAHYGFEGNVGSSTGTNSGTAFGTPGYASGPSGFGQAIRMDGDDHVQLPAGVANSADITIATWVKWDGGNAWQRLFDFGNDTSAYMFLTPSSANGTMRFAITTTGNDAEQTLDTAALPVGEWAHLAVTLGGNTGILYVNGAPRVAGHILLNPSDISPTLNYIGKSQWPDPMFRGMIDDFRIYNYALDQSQIGSLVPHAWNVDADGTWSPGSNWTYGNAPNGAGHTANFLGVISAPRTVTVTGPTRVGSLNFSSAQGILLTGTGPFTLDALTGAAQVNVSNGSPTIATPLTLADDTLMSVAFGTTLTVSNTFDGGNHLLIKTGAGTAHVSQLRNLALSVQAGTVRILPSTPTGTVPGTSLIGSLTITSGATLDLSDNALAIDYDGTSAGLLLSEVRSHLFNGRIIATAASPTSSLAVGYIDNVTLPLSSLGGLDVDTTSVLMKLGLKGDTNLDGAVNFSDLLSLAQNYNAPSNAYWSQGDSNHDGSVSFTDLLALAQNYGNTSSFAGDWVLAQSIVPEPVATTSILAFTAGMILGIRRGQPVRRNGPSGR